MQSAFQARTSQFAAVLAALCAPPAFVALCGGADLDLPFVRVSWYEAPGSVLTLAAALVASLFAPRSATGRARHWVRALWLGALASLGIAVWAATLGGFQLEGVSARHAWRPALVGSVLLALAIAAARGVVRTRVRPALLALIAGAAATVGALQLDRLDLRGQIRGAASANAAQATSADVVFVVIDTLRADAVAAGATPALDALAAESVVFDAAYAQAPWTLPSMMSLVTSRYASSLHPGWRGAWPKRFALEDEPDVLADALRKAGYHTAAFVKNPMLARGTGFERGYDVYEWVGGDDADAHSARQLVDASLRWAEEFARARRSGAVAAPFLLTVHFMDPHAHYRPPGDFVPEEARRYAGRFDGHTSTLKEMTAPPALPAREDIEQMKRLYRGEVRYVDSQLERLLDALVERELVDEDTWIVVTADHGEQFGEHGSFEHRALYNENVHVPLVVRAPGFAARRVAGPVGLIDLVPTLLEALGLPNLAGAQGRSRLASLRGEPMAAESVLTEFGLAARATDGSKVVLRDANGAFELYDRARDLLEEDDLAGRGASGFDALLRRLASHEAGIGAGAAESAPAPELPERERLEALGYVE